MRETLANDGNKVTNIINKEFDGRLAGVVITYLFDKGIENVAEITDEQISEIPGNGFMTASFSQALVRTAREIAKTCDLYKDIFPFITCKLPNAYCQAKEVTWFKEEFDDCDWQKITEDLAPGYGYEMEPENVDAIKVTYVINAVFGTED